MTKSEIESKIRVLKRKLDEMRQYKIVMAEDGIKPDTADKERESFYIVQLIRLEKQLAEKEGRPYTPHGRTPRDGQGGPSGPRRNDQRKSKGPAKGKSSDSRPKKPSDSRPKKPSDSRPKTSSDPRSKKPRPKTTRRP